MNTPFEKQEKMKCNEFEIMQSSFILEIEREVHTGESQDSMLHSFMLLQKGRGVAHMIQVCNRERDMAKCNKLFLNSIIVIDSFIIQKPLKKQSVYYDA